LMIILPDLMIILGKLMIIRLWGAVIFGRDDYFGVVDDYLPEIDDYPTLGSFDFLA